MRFLPEGRKVAGAVLSGALVCLGVWAPAAMAGPATGSVTVVGETSSYVTGGHAYRFDSDTGSVALSAGYPNGPSMALVTVNGNGSDFSLSFAAPAGQTLQVGEYTSATRYPFETAGQAGIDVSGNGAGCNQEYGRFSVRDVHLDPTGTVDRLWLFYEVHCESQGGPALFGEVRVNEPVSGTSPYAEPSAVVWPGDDIGRPARVVPIRIFAGPTDRKISAVALSGPGASDFSIRLDQCTGETLAASTGCDVFARYAPTSPGTSADAHLTVTMADSSEVDVPLAGYGYGGTTRMDLQSDPGDWVGGGVSSSYDETTANIYAYGTRESVSFSVRGYDGTYMTANFVPGRNDILVPGSTYTQASRAAFSNGGTGLEVDGNGRGCNTLSGEFTVTDINFDANGNLLDAGVAFVQHCELGVPALRGTFQWRAPTPAAAPTAPVVAVDPGTPPATGSTPAPPVAPAPPTSTPPTTPQDSASRAGLSTSRPASTPSPAPPLTETISVAGHQSARTVAISGLSVSVTCSQACTASITVRGAAPARAAAATARVSLRAGVRKTLRLRVHGGPAKHLTLTSTAQQTAPPHGVASPLTRHLSLS